MQKKETMQNILCHVGTLIVYFGIILFINQQWNVLSHTSKLLDTLGIGIITYFLGILFWRRFQMEMLGSALSLFAALLLPVGAAVFCQMYYSALYPSVYPSINNLFGISVVHLIEISAILFLIYFFTFLWMRKNLFLIFTIIFGTECTYELWLQMLLSRFSYRFFEHFSLSAYFMLLGIVYLFLGFLFSKNPLRASLSGALYGFGIFIFLTGGYFEFAVLSAPPVYPIFWQTVYPLFIFGSLYLCVLLNKKVFLVFGVLALVFYIWFIADRYFAHHISSPLLLIIMGVAVIVVSGLVVAIQRKWQQRL